MARMEIDGIEVEPVVNPGDDFEVAECFCTIFSDESTGGEKVSAMSRLLTVLFGTDAKRVKSELRAKNGGSLTHACVSRFVGEVMERSRQLKN